MELKNERERHLMNWRLGQGCFVFGLKRVECELGLLEQTVCANVCVRAKREEEDGWKKSLKRL